MNRAGVTLTELLVACTLTALVAGLVLASLSGLQRLTQAQAERSGAAAGLRTSAQLLYAELRDLSAAGSGDLLVMAPDQVVYRAPRASARACGIAPEGLLLRDTTFRALRLPAPARDTLEVLLPDTLPPNREGWVRAAIVASPRASICPDGAPALAVPVAFPGGATPAIREGSPVRTWEVMEIRSYQSGGDTWLGVRSVTAGEVIQPAAGPLAPAGFALRFLAPDGSQTADPARVSRVVVTIVHRRDPDLAVGGAARARPGGADSLSVVIRLANGALR